ncbi:hypothetical protein BDR26DRAFT_928142 [Obelidium mucronatum]|nr:hypothetical protein BDR26DRAFT_928142 [Obelidium mucronatum]
MVPELWIPNSLLQPRPGFHRVDDCPTLQNVGQCIPANSELRSCQYLSVDNFYLVMLRDANLALYSSNPATTRPVPEWTTNIPTNYFSDGYALRHTNESLSIVDPKGDIITTFTYPIVVGGNYDLCVFPGPYFGLGSFAWTVNPPVFSNFGFHVCEDIGSMMRRPNGDFCFPKQRIGPCQYLILGNYTLMMQTSGDLAGNLVLREGDNVLWTMGTSENQPRDYSFSFDTPFSISISSPSGGNSFTWSDQSLNSSSLFACIQSTTGELYSMPSVIAGLDLCESIEYLPAHSPIDKSNVHLLPGDSIMSCQYIYYHGISLLMQRESS